MNILNDDLRLLRRLASEERDTSGSLRSLPMVERTAFLMRLAESKKRLLPALGLALEYADDRTIRDLFVWGMQTFDASRIRWFVVVAVCRLGFPRTFDMIEHTLHLKSSAVDGTFFWLSAISDSMTDADRQGATALRGKARSMGRPC